MSLMIFAEDGPHTTIAPSVLFELGGFPITNSMVYGWLTATILIALFFKFRKSIKVGGNKGPSQILDFGTEFIINLLENTLLNRKMAVKYAPIFATLFFFIVFNNWFGLLPGVGTAIQYNSEPLFKAFTTDLNATIAMALFGMILVQFLAFKEQGLKRHIKHYFPLSFFNPMNYLIGAFEIFTEFTRLLSLGLRLFLNIAIGEVLISVAAYLGGSFAAPIAALPFTMLEYAVGILQAFIFVVLCIAYLAATTAGHGPETSEEHVQVDTK